MFPKRKTSELEIVIVIISVIVILIFASLEIICPCLFKQYSTIFSIVISIGTGLISAVALLFFQEQHYQKQLKEYYKEIGGQYVRIDMGQDNHKSGENEDIVSKNVGLQICLRYLENHSLKINAQYWKHEGAEVEATIEFNEKNGLVAKGRYRYIKGKGFTAHSGIYTIYRLEEDKTKLLVLYQHLFPRKNENNPDANRGWELWERINNTCD